MGAWGRRWKSRSDWFMRGMDFQAMPRVSGAAGTIKSENAWPPVTGVTGVVTGGGERVKAPVASVLVSTRGGTGWLGRWMAVENRTTRALATGEFAGSVTLPEKVMGSFCG